MKQNNQIKYIIKFDQEAHQFYIKVCKYISLSDDRMIAGFLNMKTSKYRTTLISYKGKLIDEVNIVNTFPESYSHWNRGNVSNKWRNDQRAIYFDKEEDAQNALDWLDSIMMVKTLFKH